MQMGNPEVSLGGDTQMEDSDDPEGVGQVSPG